MPYDRRQKFIITNQLASAEKLFGNYHKAIALFKKAAEEKNFQSYF
jgi:hypothetical protein